MSEKLPSVEEHLRSIQRWTGGSSGARHGNVRELVRARDEAMRMEGVSLGLKAVVVSECKAAARLGVIADNAMLWRIKKMDTPDRLREIVKGGDHE
jgi:hypothetical protein